MVETREKNSDGNRGGLNKISIVKFSENILISTDRKKSVNRNTYFATLRKCNTEPKLSFANTSEQVEKLHRLFAHLILASIIPYSELHKKVSPEKEVA